MGHPRAASSCPTIQPEEHKGSCDCTIPCLEYPVRSACCAQSQLALIDTSTEAFPALTADPDIARRPKVYARKRQQMIIRSVRAADPPKHPFISHDVPNTQPNPFLALACALALTDLLSLISSLRVMCSVFARNRTFSGTSRGY